MPKLGPKASHLRNHLYSVLPPSRIYHVSFERSFLANTVPPLTNTTTTTETRIFQTVLQKPSFKMPARRSLRSRKSLTKASSPPVQSPVSTRPRRAASNTEVKVVRNEPDSPEDSKRALRLTMKMPSSKLREATSAASLPDPRGSLDGGEIISGPRSSRAKKSYVVESESDDDEEEDEEDGEADLEPSDAEIEGGDEEDQEEQVQASDEEEAGDEEDEDDADADADADGDIDMDDTADDGVPMPPAPTLLRVKGPSKPTLIVSPIQEGKVKSVEAKEMEMEDDDEELSDLSEDDEEGDAGEEDAEGEDVDEMDQDDESRSPEAGSRGSTPDITKMTKRQRSRLDQVIGSDFLQLPMGIFFSTSTNQYRHCHLIIISAEPQTKKHLTAEEHQMRRAEMARRRKNLSEKRNEEEKVGFH